MTVSVSIKKEFSKVFFLKKKIMSMVILFIEEEKMVKQFKKSIKRAAVEVDNRYVIPYNPFPLLFFSNAY